MLLVEIGIGVATYEKRDWLKDQVGQSLNETLHQIKNDKSFIKPWDDLQKEVSEGSTLWEFEWLMF